MNNNGGLNSYTQVLDGSNNGALLLGGTTDPTNYYQNTIHYFRNRTGGTIYGSIGSTGFLPGVDNTSPCGSAALRWSDVRSVTATFSGAVATGALTVMGAARVNAGSDLSAYGPGNSNRIRFVHDDTRGYCQSAGGLLFSGVGGAAGNMNFEGILQPQSDNTYTLGSASLRWSQLYAGTATINTSDAREKTALADVPEALLDAILAVPIGAYQWLDSVARKGPDGARIHFGPTAQHVRDAILAKGLDPERFALFCRDPKLARVAKTRIVTRPVAPEIVRIEKVVIEGGRAILKTIAEERAVTRKVTVEDENGAPVMRSMPAAANDSGHDTGPAFEPLTAEIPVTEEIEETYETFEPIAGEFVYGLRLEQFYALLGLAIRRKAGF